MWWRPVPSSVSPMYMRTVVWGSAAVRGAVVAPGGDVERILRAADDNGIFLEKILLTHGHLAHAGGAADLAQRRGLPIEGPHLADLFWLDGMAQHGVIAGG